MEQYNKNIMASSIKNDQEKPIDSYSKRGVSFAKEDVHQALSAVNQQRARNEKAERDRLATPHIKNKKNHKNPAFNDSYVTHGKNAFVAAIKGFLPNEGTKQ